MTFLLGFAPLNPTYGTALRTTHSHAVTLSPEYSGRRVSPRRLTFLVSERGRANAVRPYQRGGYCHPAPGGRSMLRPYGTRFPRRVPNNGRTHRSAPTVRISPSRLETSRRGARVSPFQGLDLWDDGRSPSPEVSGPGDNGTTLSGPGFVGRWPVTQSRGLGTGL